MICKITFNTKLFKRLFGSTLFFWLITLCFNVSHSYSSGFAIYAHGAKELALCDSVVAHTEGPVSNLYNPALIAEYPFFFEGKGDKDSRGRIQFESTHTFVIPKIKFDSSEKDVKAETESQVFWLPTHYGTVKLNDNVTFGLGIYNPFGLGTKWPDDWEGRYLATNSEMLTLNLNPNIAWEINKHLVVAVGGDFLYGDVTLENNIPLKEYDDGRQKFEGDGTAWGYNFGLLIRYEPFSLGLSYRSGFDLELKGDVKTGLPAEFPADYAVSFPKTNADVDIHLPEQFFWGIAFRPTDKFVFEVGGKWEGWSSYDTLELNLDKPIAGQTKKVVDKNWEDVIGFNCGAKYYFPSGFSLALGYLYEDNPVPDETLEPAVPANEKHLFSVGIQKDIYLEPKGRKMSIALSYLHEEYRTRKKENELPESYDHTANGKYEQYSNIFAGSVSLEF